MEHSPSLPPDAQKHPDDREQPSIHDPSGDSFQFSVKQPRSENHQENRNPGDGDNLQEIPVLNGCPEEQGGQGVEQRPYHDEE